MEPLELIPSEHPSQKSCTSTTKVLWKKLQLMIHEPKEDNPYIYPSYNWDGSLETAKLETNYENKYSSTTHLKPLCIVLPHQKFQSQATFKEK
ncbi:unnamed protein product [Gulo gulo]|uniref:Uncharacterized protein n=1 Tax=Gulo gulo TaxID=48420 RepID=A0A9X9LF78_GULGU|nr:unnamed protein product [Gulo gulo]